jgi:hypothetical protein
MSVLNSSLHVFEQHLLLFLVVCVHVYLVVCMHLRKYVIHVYSKTCCILYALEQERSSQYAYAYLCTCVPICMCMYTYIHL